MPRDEPRETRKKHRRRRKRRFAVPAWLVFGVSTLLSAGAAGLVYLRGAPYLPLSILAVVLLLAVLLLDERGGFTRSRRLRRSGEVRVTFTQAEVAVLFVLLLLCAFVSLQAWVT